MGPGNTLTQSEDLCDHISAFLDSPADLVSCAVVSPVFTVSAQRHLFRDIEFHGNTRGAACSQLCSAVKTSPHLLRFIRRLQVALCLDELEQLHTLDFPNLEEIAIVSQSTVLNDIQLHGLDLLAARIISLPSVRRVELGQVMLEMAQLQRLFERFTPRLEALSLNHPFIIRFVTPDVTIPPRRPPIRILRLQHMSSGWKWLSIPVCPFDFTQLRTFELMEATPTPLHTRYSALLAPSRLTLTNLTMDLPSVRH
ncbi:hypothetical protein B0H19DRAFT_1141789 [Mycena capillaripes]|nr:hypothetical protein B0H19DRAFT_1141789 [Mycena capillaripes]